MTAPSEGLITRNGTIGVSGTATDDTPLRLTLNGALLSVASGTGAFTTTFPLTAEGPATLTLVERENEVVARLAKKLNLGR